MTETAAHIRDYLQRVLGIALEMGRATADRPGVPYHATQGFGFVEARLAGHPVLFAIDAATGAISVNRVLRSFAQLRRNDAPLPVFVRAHITGADRRRLIAARIPFVVPGSQMYLPDLGIDLRERLARPVASRASGTFTPAAQALLLRLFVRRVGDAPWHPREELAALGYTAMSASRAAAELVEAGVAFVEHVGRERWCVLTDTPQRIWEREAARFTSPVKRVVWVRPSMTSPTMHPLCGDSALAERTDLAPPTWVEHAVRARDIAAAEVIPEWEPGAERWEEWTYGPTVTDYERRIVDSFSLVLSRRDDADERVQQAVAMLESKLPW